MQAGCTLLLSVMQRGVAVVVLQVWVGLPFEQKLRKKTE